MALSKKNKQKSDLLTAALIAGGVIGLTLAGVGLYNLNNSVDSLKSENMELKKNIDSLNKDLKKHSDSLEQKEKDLKVLSTEKDEILNSIEELKKENKSLKRKLQERQEASAKARTLAECPTQSRSAVNKGTPVQMTLTFYGDFAHENGGYSGIDAQGNKLVAGTVASNVYSFGTQFYFNGQVYTVRDRGGSNFNSSNRLDVFVPRKSGESDSSYAKRIRQYGRKTVTMYKF